MNNPLHKEKNRITDIYLEVKKLDFEIYKNVIYRASIIRASNDLNVNIAAQIELSMMELAMDLLMRKST